MRNNIIPLELEKLIEIQLKAHNLSQHLLLFMMENEIQILDMSPIEWATKFELNINNEHPQKWLSSHYTGEENILHSNLKPFDNKYKSGDKIADIKKEVLLNDISQAIQGSKNLDKLLTDLNTDPDINNIKARVGNRVGGVRK